MLDSIRSDRETTRGRGTEAGPTGWCLSFSSLPKASLWWSGKDDDVERRTASVPSAIAA